VIVPVARLLRLLVVLAAAAALPAERALPAARHLPDPARSGAHGPSADSALGPEALNRYLAGRLLEERGMDVDAIEEYQQALRLDPGRPEIELRVSETAARLGEAQRSFEAAGLVLAREPGNARALWLQGSALFNLGRTDESLRSLQAAVAADSGQVDYWKTLAHVAEAIDRIDVVASGWRHAVELDDSDGEAWFQLAAAEARLGQFEAADSMLAEAMRLNPARPGGLFLEGWIQEGQGHATDAVQLYRQHLQIHPDDQITRRRLVNLLVEMERYVEAYRESDLVRGAQPGDPEAIGVEADLALRLGHETRARELLDELLATDPDDPSRVARAAGVLAHRGHPRDAAARAEDWALRHPADHRGALLMAQVRLETGDTLGAVAAAQRAVAMAPDSAAPRFIVGRLLQSAGRYAAAESVWVGLARQGPGAARAGLDLAYCREQLGNMDGAVQAARDVLGSEPDNASALNFLSYLFADHDRDLPEAESLVSRALALEPDNGAYVDTRGWVYYRLGRLADARRELERAVQLTHGDPVVREHLGDVYKDLGLFDLAREQYQHGLDDDRDNARLRAKLSHLH
jgi:tetratricopeptide (TPR) repeat protein